MKPRPIVIVGVSRSGTTLLRLMLNAHPRIAIPYESNIIVKYSQALSQYGDLSKRENLERLIAAIVNEPLVQKWNHTFDLVRLTERVEHPNLTSVVEAVFQDYASQQDKPRWGDKSGQLSRMDIVKKILPDAQFIHIIRDGRDVAGSALKLHFGPTDILMAASSWCMYVTLGRRMGAMLDAKSYIEVRYEDLVRCPEKELRRICDYLDEDYSPQMLEYHRNARNYLPQSAEHHYNTDRAPITDRVFAWKSKMNESDLWLFQRRARDVLAELGYEVPAVRPKRLRLLWRVIRIMAHRVRRFKFDVS
jgi:hypothetical protein